MASSRKYPHRLYEVGKTPIQSRSMNHNYVWSELRESPIGVIVKLKEVNYTWSAKVVHHFLANQLAIESSHELWSLIDCMPLRFSLYEFEAITGLNCDPFDKHGVWDVDHREFWLEMKVPTSDGPTLQELQAIFPICRNWSREKRVMVAFQRYPWGCVGFSSLVESIKVVTYEGKKTYTLHGCVHALLIWIYESVHGLGELYGNRIEGVDVPLLSWGGSRARINFSDFCAQEKVSGDILNGQLNEKFWDAMPSTKCEKRKYGVAASVVPNPSPSTKRRKGKEPADGGEASDMIAAHNVAILGLVESIKILTAKIEDIDVSVADKVSKALEATIDAKVEARVGVYDFDLRKIIAKLKEDINYLKNNADGNISPDVAKPMAYEDDGACSNDLSWILQKKINSEDGLPIDCVVKKEKKAKKMIEEEDLANKEVKKTEKKAGTPLRRVKQEKGFEIPELSDLANKEVNLTEKKDGIPLRRVKQEKAFEIPELNDESISSESWENHLQWEKSVNCRAVLEALASTLEEPTRRRKPQLTKTQVWPYLGNSTVKRIITGEKDSKEPYDPLAKVEAGKLQKVLDFIKSDLDAKEPGTGDDSAGFFLKLMIPRDTRPIENYGWLHASHIAVAMLMFHRRSRQEQSPYSSSRIAFLSRWFVNSWVNDYKNWDQNMKELSEMYSKAFNGEHPADFVTGKKWISEVDDLFLCHHVNGNHWVAIRIDLRKEAIHHIYYLQQLLHTTSQRSFHQVSIIFSCCKPTCHH
ncbi:hypothetical protein Bca52824_025749 [Brassica carinata]|uniref:Ubiquitin-like protease family profile domain-containing protein n=1 Tax=Brassica carinata TaxID=52824 RepID=A0A8X7V9K6_BRACI|nr:hypothetical protein Bca52824_025749 [Brassica carinata]